MSTVTVSSDLYSVSSKAISNAAVLIFTSLLTVSTETGSPVASPIETFSKVNSAVPLAVDSALNSISITVPVVESAFPLATASDTLSGPSAELI